MNHLLKTILVPCMAVVCFAGCEKTASLTVYQPGTAATLSASTATIAPAPADSMKTAVTFTWTSPKYSVDSSTVKYIIEIDSSGRNFAKEVTYTVTGTRNYSLIAKDLNNVLLAYGFSYNTTYNMDVRVTSSYSNNNEQLKSNTVTLKVTTYKIPPKVAPPASGRLFLVGSATAGGWSNPVPTPTQEFSKIDSVTWGGIFNLAGGNEYLVLPVNGDWTHKYSVADKTVAGLNAGGGFGADFSDNIPGPSATGMYKIILDFQHGTFNVTAFTGVLPANLFLVGDATPGGWSNPVPVPGQQFTQDNATQFSLTVPLTGGKQYLMLPVNGDWGHKFAVDDNTIASLKTGGTFKYDAGQNFPGPDVTGAYKYVVNFVNYSFTLTKQ